MNFAVVFPGQGSQSTGMLASLAEQHSDVGTTFAEANDVLSQDLWTLAQNGPDEKLMDTRITQPLMFTSAVAVWRALRSAGLPSPSAIAGHSLGEFAALVAAEALSFADGLKLVSHRSQLMAAAVPEGEGGMAALLGMSDEEVIAVCADTPTERVTEAANFNAPGQVAISGHKDALEKTVELARERGARKAIILAVSVPNHSSLMRSAGEKLIETIDSLQWQQPVVPVVQNAQATAPANLDALLSSLRAHVYSPVQWTQTVQHLRDEYKVTQVIESGPGKVLAGLGRRIDKKLPTVCVDAPDTLEAAIQAVSTSNAEA